jgi:hypothetical protein
MEASKGYDRPDGATQAGLHRTAVAGLGETVTVMLATVGAAGVDTESSQDEVTSRIAAAQPARRQNPDCGKLIASVDEASGVRPASAVVTRGGRGLHFCRQSSPRVSAPTALNRPGLPGRHDQSSIAQGLYL